VLDDDAGVAFRVADPDALALRISQVAADPDGWRNRRPLARRSYEQRYSPDVDLRRLETVYADVIGRAS